MQRAQITDLLAGAAAATVILPQSMAFGVTLLAPYGLSGATGAIMGLIGAAAISLASGIVGGTRGLVSAPTGPTLVLLSGALAQLSKAGLQGEALLVGLAYVMLATGLIQILIGASGGGRLVKFIPYPVIVGFMTGSGILMVLSQRRPLSGAGDPWDVWNWMPAATAAFTYLVMALVPRVTRRVPGTIAGLLGGAAFFHLLVWLSPRPAPADWVIGALPGVESIDVAVVHASITGQPWGVILASSLALAVLASLDTLLTALVADVETGHRHSARAELMGQGMGQILSGLLGGMAGAGTTGATVVATSTGGRRWVGVAVGAVFVVFVVIGRPIGLVLPTSVLAGIILYVGVHMLDRDIWYWARRRRTRAEAAVAVIVASVTVAYDLMVAVGFGVAIAIIIFLREQVRAPVVHARTTGRQRHSLWKRSEAQRKLLDEHGDRIVLYELRGNLFFATADRLLSELAADLSRPAWVILDIRRVQRIDLTGVKLIEQMATKLSAAGGELVFCRVHREVGVGKKIKKAIKKVDPDVHLGRLKTFNGSDEALEYAENQLLAELGAPAEDLSATVDLAASDLCLHMAPEHVAELERRVQRLTFEAGEEIFAYGSVGNDLYVVRSGVVEVRIPTTEHHYKRLATYGPGTVFGEVAFLDPGPRSAAAVARTSAEILVLSSADFEALADDLPRAAVAVLTQLARAQGQALRWTTAELHRVSWW